MSFVIDPPAAVVPAGGGLCAHIFTNKTDQRLVFKVKASNTDNYRVKPVYGFVDSKATTVFEITRSDGLPKDDKFVVQFASVTTEDDNTSAESAFRSTTPIGEVNLPIKALASADQPIQ